MRLLLLGVLLFGRCSSGTDSSQRVDAGPQAPATTAPEAEHVDGPRDELSPLREAVAKNPRDVRALLELGGRLLGRAVELGNLTDHFEAERHTGLAIAVAPSLEAHLLRGQSRLALGRATSAHADAERAIALDPTNLDAQLLAADTAVETGRTLSVRPMLEKLATRDAGPYVLGRLANVQMRLGETSKAQRTFERAARAVTGPDPRPAAWLFLQRGVFEIERGRFAEALTLLREALMRRPMDRNVMSLIPEMERLGGNLPLARNAAEALLPQGGGLGVRSALAAILRDLGETGPAAGLVEATAQESEEQYAAFPEAIARDLARFYLRFDRNEARALELAKRAVSEAPSAESLRVLALAELALGHLPEARAAIDRALAQGEKTARLTIASSRIFEAAGDARAAQAEKARALRSNPNVERLPP